MLAQHDHGPAEGVQFDLPAWIVTALGFALGLLGIAYLIAHPEPPSVWVVEVALVVLPASTLAYGGYWLATRSPDRVDRWVAAAWTFSGALITSAFVIGYALSERFSGSIVTEITQLALFGALSGSSVALLAVITIQHQYRRRELPRSNEPTDAIVFKWHVISRVIRALRRGKVAGLLGLVTEVSFGRNLWIAYLSRFRTVDGLVPFETRGVTLFLDPADRGISTDLLRYGAREEVATEVLREETELLGSSMDGPITAVDIGANRGYYAFQLADLLGAGDTVYAIEPEPHNITSLRRGVEANRLANVVIEQGAIGAEDGVQELMISNRSSSHTLDTDLLEAKRDKYISAIEVPVWSIESFLDMHGLDPGGVNLVKVDVEGYEPAVIESMDVLFEADAPDVLFVELHPHRVNTADLHEIVDTIETNGFEIVKASSSAAADLQTYRSVREHVATDAGSHTVELIVRTPGIEDRRGA